MMDFILRNISHVKSVDILHIEAVHPKHADKDISDLYARIEVDNILSAPMTIHSPYYPLLEAAWAMLRETFIVSTAVSKHQKESVALAVSESNTCLYCTEVHNIFIRTLQRIEKKRSGNATGSASDVNNGAIMRWAGNTRYRNSDALANPPFTREEAPEYIGVAVLYHYINRIVNVFCHESGFAMKGMPDQIIAVARASFSLMMEKVLGREAEAGISVSTFTDNTLPDDMSWCNGNEYIARAFIAFDTTINDLAHKHISPNVLQYVDQRIFGWDGTDPGLGSEWLQDIPAGFSAGDRAVARLALVVAFASYRANGDIIAEARARLEGDVGLLAVVSWASFRSARLIGSWIPIPQAHPQR